VVGNKEKALNIDEIYRLIRNLVGQAHILTIPRVFIDYTGNISSALLLGQLIYWSERTTRLDGYIWKSYKEWEEELSLSKYQVCKAVKVLKNLGILKTVVRKAEGSPTVHYKLDEVEFSKSIVKFLNNRKSNNSTIESAKNKLSTNIACKQSVQTEHTNDKENAICPLGANCTGSLEKKSNTPYEEGFIGPLENQVISEYYKVYQEVRGATSSRKRKAIARGKLYVEGFCR
jgi:hypothetical protein